MRRIAFGATDFSNTIRSSALNRLSTNVSDLPLDIGGLMPMRSRGKFCVLSARIIDSTP